MYISWNITGKDLLIVFIITFYQERLDQFLPFKPSRSYLLRCQIYGKFQTIYDKSRYKLTKKLNRSSILYKINSFLFRISSPTRNAEISSAKTLRLNSFGGQITIDSLDDIHFETSSNVSAAISCTIEHTFMRYIKNAFNSISKKNLCL